jgi:PHD/YefM family antitoxin component YafN of YafNO toxin-antitoxin module
MVIDRRYVPFAMARPPLTAGKPSAIIVSVATIITVEVIDMATVVSALEMRQGLGDKLERAYHRNERFIIERKGKAMAALIGVEEYEAILPFLENIEDLRDAEEAMAEYRAGRGRPFAEFLQELGFQGPAPRPEDSQDPGE